MPIEIILPALTERVTVRDIPELFASAIHHEEPEVEQATEVELLQSMRWCATVDAWTEEIGNAILRGELEPCSQLTLLPIPQAIGEQLQDAFVTVENLKEYAARKAIVLSVQPVAKVSKAPPPITPISGTSWSSPRVTARVPDWDFWRHMQQAEVWQVCALSLNIDPDSLERGAYGRWRGFASNEVAERFDKRIRLYSNVTNARAHSEIKWSDFALWAVKEMKWDDLPPELVALAQKPAADPSGAAEKAESSVPSQVRAEIGESASSDWRESARAIADECFERDTANKCRDSMAGYARRVMDEMQERAIHGPRGLIDNSKTIEREALQGARWWKHKKK